MKNQTIHQWITSVKPVALWILITAILFQVVQALLIHYVVFPSGMLHPLHIATGGIISATFQVYVLYFLASGLLLCYLGKLRSNDFALFSKKIAFGLTMTLFAWGMIQTTPLLMGQSLQIESGWDNIVIARDRISQFFMDQLFGNALYEELFYRALLISQLTIIFMRKFTSTWAILLAIICASIIFALIHMPNRLTSGMPIEDVLCYSMPNLFFMGLIFSVIFLLTKNIFVAVGIHALSNDSPNIFENVDQHSSDQFVAVVLVYLFLRWCYRKCRKVEMDNSESIGYKYMLISLSLIAVFSDTFVSLIRLSFGY